MKIYVLNLFFLLPFFVLQPAKAQPQDCSPLFKSYEGPFHRIDFNYSKGSARTALYTVLPQIAEKAGQHYLIVVKEMGSDFIEKLIRQYDRNPQIRQFIRNLLEDLIQNPYWTKTKARLIIQSFEYIAMDISFFRNPESYRILHLLIKTIISKPEVSQHYLLLRLDAINERRLIHNDFQDLFE